MIGTQIDEKLLPVEPNTKRPLGPMRQPGYYPGFSTMGQRNFWDAATREMVEKRVYEVPNIRFFTPEELPLMQAVCDRILPQEDRLAEFRIPIVNYIDERLYNNEIDGYRYADMPPDREAHKLGLQAINETAYAMYSKLFLDLEPLEQDYVLKSIHDGEKKAAHEIWNQMSIDRYWHLLVQDCVTAYYAHPWAWDEIGFGGPAYPRAYTRLENGDPEPWEKDEQRYEWEAPVTSISDRYEETGAGGGTTHQGQGGTH
jgi:hypothetical protein